MLHSIDFGSRTAEDEADGLSKYFIETDQWKRVLRGDIDIIYGAKGAGKSAIYTLLDKSRDYLFGGGIIVASAENPRGATVFRNMVADPPATEQEFVYFWKVYILGILGKQFVQYNLSRQKAANFVSHVQEMNLLPEQGGLSKLFKSAKSVVSDLLKRRAMKVTWSASIDPSTGIPLPARTAEYESAAAKSKNDLLDSFDVDDALHQASEALHEEDFKCWILFDRLDVAFQESKDLEKNALRALFKVYNDLKGLPQIGLKIFVRDDIWRRITETGFAEASHITRSVTIRWDKESLLNLAVRRLLNNQSISELFMEDQSAILRNFEIQSNLFYYFFPDQIDSGVNKADTFEWILGRTKDGTGLNTPRELIHFLTELRNEQLRRLERGDEPPLGTQLFDRSVFKPALKIVSEARLAQTLFAEYPEMQSRITALKQERTLHTAATLSNVWQVDIAEAQSCAMKLVGIGFFEQRGNKVTPQFWVPFIYREALEMVQGTA